jgi:hypothetical protein
MTKARNPCSRLAVASAVVLLSAWTAYAFGVVCPIDGMAMIYTGKTQSDSGRILQEYKCPRGHVQWVIQ